MTLYCFSVATPCWACLGGLGTEGKDFVDSFFKQRTENINSIASTRKHISCASQQEIREIATQHTGHMQIWSGATVGMVHGI